MTLLILSQGVPTLKTGNIFQNLFYTYLKGTESLLIGVTPGIAVVRVSRIRHQLYTVAIIITFVFIAYFFKLFNCWTLYKISPGTLQKVRTAQN